MPSTVVPWRPSPASGPASGAGEPSFRLEKGHANEPALCWNRRQARRPFCAVVHIQDSARRWQVSPRRPSAAFAAVLPQGAPASGRGGSGHVPVPWLSAQHRPTLPTSPPGRGSGDRTRLFFIAATSTDLRERPASGDARVQVLHSEAGPGAFPAHATRRAPSFSPDSPRRLARGAQKPLRSRPPLHPPTPRGSRPPALRPPSLLGGGGLSLGRSNGSRGRLSLSWAVGPSLLLVASSVGHVVSTDSSSSEVTPGS